MNIEQEIEKIQERNARVEKDKAWEISKVRKIAVCLILYIIVLAFSKLVDLGSNIYLASAVPVIGYFLSTASLSIIRRIWERKKR